MFASTCSRHVARRFFNSVQVILSFGDRLMTIESLKKIKLFGLRSGRQPLFYQDALLPNQSSRPCPQRVEQLDSMILEPFEQRDSMRPIR